MSRRLSPSNCVNHAVAEPWVGHQLYVEAGILVAPEISVVVAHLKGNYTFKWYGKTFQCNSESLSEFLGD